MTLLSSQPTKPMLVERVLLPVPMRITLLRSLRPWSYQVPLPVGPMQPKSCAQSINK